MAELWDAYDRNFNKIENVTLVRGEGVPEGIYHLVADVIVKHTDGTYLLMQRDFRKHRGGMWELTSGGSALKGENGLQCGMRELKEETGIDAMDLKEVGRFVIDEHQSVYTEFFCITDCQKDSIVFQEGETIAYKWVDRETLFAMTPEELLTQRAREIVKKLNL